MVSENEIQDAFNSYLKEEELELYELNLVNFPNITKVEVYVYSEKDVNISLTARLNRQLLRILHEFGYEKGSFEMIVSSPGIERKLKTLRHYELALGELVKIKLFSPVNGDYLLEGIINEVHEHVINLSVNEETVILNIDEIKNAKIEFKQFKEKIKG